MRVRTERQVVCAVQLPSGLLGETFNATLLDVSVGGLAITTAADVLPGARIRVKLRFDDPPLDLAVIVLGTHARKGGEGTVFGGIIEGLEQPARTAITRFVFAEAKRTGTGTETATLPDIGNDPFAPGAIESALRLEAVPPGHGPTTWVDMVTASAVQLILEGDAWARRKYPQTAEMIDYHVKHHAMLLAREQRKAS